MRTTETKIKPFWKRWLCVHNFTPEIRVVYDSGRKKHARICIKCGQRDYID